MELVIVCAFIIIGIVGFILTSMQASKRNYPPDYICVWLFAAIAAWSMLYLLISRW